MAYLFILIFCWLISAIFTILYLRRRETLYENHLKKLGANIDVYKQALRADISLSKEIMIHVRASFIWALLAAVPISALYFILNKIFI